MPQIRPISDLRDTNEVIKICHARPEPIFFTNNGYGDLVVMSMETYDSITRTVEMDAAIAEAEAEFEQDGELFDAEDTFAALRRKHFG